MSSSSRRHFLRTSAGLTAGAALAAAKPAAAATAASAKRIMGANDRIRVGLIGCGGMGRTDLADCLTVENTECVALCDVDPSHIAEAQEKVLDPVSQKAELRAQDFRHVLDRKDIHAVIVATPDHWHAIPTVMACQAGKGRLRRETACTDHCRRSSDGGGSAQIQPRGSDGNTAT